MKKLLKKLRIFFTIFHYPRKSKVILLQASNSIAVNEPTNIFVQIQKSMDFEIILTDKIQFSTTYYFFLYRKMDFNLKVYISSVEWCFSTFYHVKKFYPNLEVGTSKVRFSSQKQLFLHEMGEKSTLVDFFSIERRKGQFLRCCVKIFFRICKKLPSTDAFKDPSIQRYRGRMAEKIGNT